MNDSIDDRHAGAASIEARDTPDAVARHPGMDRASLLLRAGALVLLGVLILMAFMPALSAHFVHWDDDDLLFMEARYQQLDAESLGWMFTTSYAGHFQPLTWLSFTLDYCLWRYNAFGYHLTNVALHLLTAFAFYFVARRLLALGVGNADVRRSRIVVVAAAFAAAVFAVHPLRAESVAWIAERRDVLSGLFYVLAVLAYVRYASGQATSHFVATRGLQGGSRGLDYAAAVIFCTLSLLAKASAVMLPLVLFVLDIYPLRRLWREGGKIRIGRHVWRDKMPFLVLGLAAGMRAVQAQAAGGALNSLQDHGVAARLAQVCYGLVFYLWKTVWPTALGPLYPIPSQGVLLGGMLWLSLGTLAVLGVVVIKTYRRWPAFAAALAVYVIQVLPVLGLMQSGPQLVADRYSYLSCLGLAVLAGALLMQWLGRESVWRRPGRLGLTAVAGFALVTVLSHATYAQNAVWDTPLSLWLQGTRVSPGSSIANVNLADALAVNGYPRAAIRYYRRGLAIDPTDEIAASHFGQALERTGNLDGAARMYAAALKLDPTRGDDYLRLVHVLLRQGDTSRALELLRRRAKAAPEDPEVLTLLAEVLATHPEESVRDGKEAVRWATKLKRLKTVDQGIALLHLATALAESGRFDDALKAVEAALALSSVQENQQLSDELRRRRALFRTGQPYHYGSAAPMPEEVD